MLRSSDLAGAEGEGSGAVCSGDFRRLEVVNDSVNTVFKEIFAEVDQEA